MTSLVMMNFFTNVIDVYLLYYFIKCLTDNPKKENLRTYLLLLFAILCNTVINTTAGLVTITGFIMIVISLTLIFNFIFDKNKLLKIFILLSLGLLLILLIELIIVNIISIFFRIPPKMLLEINYYKLIAVILTRTIFILVVHYRKKVFKEMFNRVKQLSIYPILILIIVNLLAVFMAFIFYSYADVNSKVESAYIIGMGIAAIIVSCIIIWIIKKMIDQQKMEFLWQMREKEYENQHIYIEHIQDVIQTLRAQRHDFNNYVSTIYGLIQLGKLEEAKKYILNLSKDVVDLNEIVNVYHPVVGAVLNMKKEKATISKIDFNVDVDIPTKLPFDFVDLSTILGNLLDNAIEACEKIPHLSPKVDIKIYMKDIHMIIKIENSKSDKVIYNNDKLGRFVTTKADKENHGLGLRNVKKAVNKYNGVMKIQDKGTEFIVDIALPAKESVAFQLNI
ncbi:sensor histidine kinase [Alkaliphilus sp. B6464]|uniref:sensor histidine kinase n=1 Tax=Alkaliphilus sp. B6464 TaxID=2731219 RepID=UPI001BA6DD95|nr:GHKL domain-containing protein [Alkaliphilus sp. B6464]QUH19811.1 GHKL domain-containing protein [Alkaliphilus sp. B6464]